MSTEREKFETWASREGYDVDHHEQIPERYAAPSATRAWNAWQARASLSAPESAPAEVRYLQERLEAVSADAVRYRWLREQEWFSGPSLCVLRNPKEILMSGNGLGADCPSHDRLDAAIDAELSASPPPRVALEKPD